MKKILLSTIIALLISGFATMATAQAEENKMTDKKVLIVYYSYSDNTEQIAKYIQETVGGELFKVEPVASYPSELNEIARQSKKEIEDGYLPTIKVKVENIKDYEVVFVGSPCWWDTIAPPVSTFLSEHDLSGKIIVPFSTHEGSGLARNASDTAKLTPNAKVLEGKAFRGSGVSSAKEEVITWINELKL